MKRILIASTLLATFAGGAALANERANERPDNAAITTGAGELREVTAQSIFNSRDLSKWNLAADDTVSVTVFPSTGKVDRPSRND
jgi:hypothetical protein